MAELGLDGSGFRAGFNQARGVAAGVSQGLRNLVVQAVGIGAVEQAIAKTIETAKELITTSERLGIAPEKLQVMREAAKQTGLEFDSLATAIEKVGIAREHALTPGDEGDKYRRAFGALGIGQDQLHSQTSAQLLMGGIRNQVLTRNPEELGVIFRELGMKAFGQLIPYLKTDFDSLGEKMKAMGAIMDSVTITKLKALSDGFSLLTQIITSQVGPALLKFTEWAYSVILKAGSKLAAGAAAAGAATAGMGPVDTITSGISALGHILSHSLGFLSDAEYEKRMAPLFNWQAAEAAMGPAMEPWKKSMEQFQRQLAEAAKRAAELEHPKPPDFTTPSIPPKLSRQALETPTDPLVRVGNFLGAGSNRIAQLAEKRTQLLQQIANNTKPRPRSGRTFTGDAEPTFFPIT